MGQFGVVARVRLIIVGLAALAIACGVVLVAGQRTNHEGAPKERETESEVKRPGELNRALNPTPAHDAATTAGLRPGAHSAGLRAAARLSAAGRSLPGSGGTWAPAGTGPLIADDPAYPQTAGEGFHNLAGRVTSFAYDSAHRVLYLSEGQGGVWKSTDQSDHWTSIGDGLPSQPVGSVAYTPAGGGAVIAVTGNDTFGGGTGSSGSGVWRTTDGGAHWNHSPGVPSDALGFKAAVDPNNPSIVYAATGAGLYRSTDAGQTFTNVNLPTGFTGGDPSAAPLSPNCTGQFKVPKCFLANMVTDVVVQGPANSQSAGGKPGAVLAVVGWRAGNKANPNGSYPESPNNGVYTSDSGAPGSFKRVDAGPVFGDQSSIGRTELGIATGADQNHQIVYAIVADANAFKGGEAYGIDVPVSGTPAPTTTYLRGIFVTKDFGKSWTLIENSSQFVGDPASQSSLVGAGCAAQMYCPGIQAWYNEWIAPDPSRADASGTPTRVVLGLEEVWQNRLTNLAVDNPSNSFKVVGRYFGGSTCQFFDLGLPVCPTNGADPSGDTLHPDQHAGLFIDPGDGVTLLAGNDGGAYKQKVDAASDFSTTGWGKGQQDGLHTLLPYDAQIANDGTIVAGLQDNGQLKISPDGKQNEIYDGDAFYTAIDPSNSKTIYEEYTYGQINKTVDGGANWSSVRDADTSGQFGTPLSMDPTDPAHLITGGEFAEETTSGGSFTQVFDLGTTPEGPARSITAVATQGDASYVGWCGACQTLTTKPFASGIATNQGGTAPGKKGASDGWHLAKGEGLPQRMVSDVTVDPNDPRTVYATLATYSRRWLPAGVVGEDTSKLGTGHVFVSHDAGEHFSDLSGNLPDVPANGVLRRGDQLVAATDTGVYVSSALSCPAMRWEPLGDNLPAGLQVLGIALKANDPSTLVAATHGRGVYRYSFADPANAVPCGRTGEPVGGAKACVSRTGFSSVSTRPRARKLGVRFTRTVPAGATVDVLRVSRGRKVSAKGGRRVARFTNQTKAFTWAPKRLTDGYYYLRYRVALPAGGSDVRRTVVVRRHGRFVKRRTFESGSPCTLRARLSLPAFGGASNVPLRIAVTPAVASTIRVLVYRGKRVVHRYSASKRTTTARFTLKATKLRRGDYTVRVTAGKEKATLLSARL